MKKALLIGAAALGLVAIASVAVWQASGDDSRRQGALASVLPRVVSEVPLTLSWRGDWSAETAYAPGNVVNHDGVRYVAESENLTTPKFDCADCGWIALESGSTETKEEEAAAPRDLEYVYQDGTLPRGFVSGGIIFKLTCPKGKVPLSGGLWKYHPPHPQVKVAWTALLGYTYDAGVTSGSLVRTGVWGLALYASLPLTSETDVTVHTICAVVD